MSKRDETQILQAAVARGTVVPWLGNSDALMQVNSDSDDVDVLAALWPINLSLTPPHH